MSHRELSDAEFKTSIINKVKKPEDKMENFTRTSIFTKGKMQL